METSPKHKISYTLVRFHSDQGSQFTSSENYGDWRTPVIEFETVVDTPNMIVSDKDHLIWCYLIKLSDYYSSGKIPQFRRVYKNLGDILDMGKILQLLCEQVADGTSSLNKKSALYEKIRTSIAKIASKALRS